MLSMGTIKMCLIITNILFLILGIFLIMIATDMRSKVMPGEAKDIESDGTPSLVFGGIMFCMAFLGFFGTFTESYTTLTMYKLTCALVMFVKLVSGLITVLYAQNMDKGDYRSEIRSTINFLFEEYKKGHQDNMNTLQINVQCCGISDYSDWTDPYPGSCCGKINGTCTEVEIYRESCTDKVYRTHKLLARNMGISFLAVAIIEIAGITFACILRESLEPDY